MSQAKTSPIKKAVFPVAGMGTRFLPATKAMPKELLPIIDRPLIQYAVEEAIAAGVTELIFITGRNKRAIVDHFDANPELERVLANSGKDALLKSITGVVPKNVNCIFVRQPEPLGLGHAVLCAKPVVGHEPFLVLLADDLMVGKTPVCADLIEAYEQSGKSVISVIEVEESEAHNYGMCATEGPGAGNTFKVNGLIEKPKGKPPSRWASVGRYLLTGDVMKALETQGPGSNGEIQLADAIDTVAKRGGVYALPHRGTRYDCGSKFGYLEAIVDFALQSDEFGDRFADLLKQRARFETLAK